MVNLYRKAASGYDGSTQKINIGGTYYGKTWNEEDQANYDLYLKSLEFDQNRMLQLDERDYNSPASQAARMREAGLNPDLQGISPDQSPSMSIDSPSAPAGQSSIDRAVKISSIAKDFLSLLPQAVNLVNSVQGGIMNVQNMRFNQLKEGSSLAQEDFLNSITSEWFDDKGNLKSDVRDNIHRYVSTSEHVFPIRSERKPTRFEKSYWSELQRLVNSSNESIKDMRYRKAYDSESHRQNFLSLLGAHGANLKDDDLVNILRDYNKLVYEVSKSSQQETLDKINVNLSRKFMANGVEKWNNGDMMLGALEYILGMLMQANYTISPTGFTFGLSSQK